MSTEELYGIYCSCGYRVTTDSRRISGGEIFFALKGENFDGNDYAAAALRNGAACAVADRAGLGTDPRLIIVDDALKTLQKLAVYHRTHVREGRLKVLGLTGTNGKTTTKNLIRAVLSRKYRVSATEGNLNNDIGVPLTLLSIRPDTEIAVVEMGANHPDDIARLVEICRPDCGLITNVGKAHLQGFGSFEGVKAAKGALYKWLDGRPGSMIFINGDDPDLRGMSENIAAHFYDYGLSCDRVSVLEPSAEKPLLALRLSDGTIVRTRLAGSYNAPNVLAALAVGRRFGVPREQAIAAVEDFVPDNIRSQMVKTRSNTVIMDAYNANPSSMKAAIENFTMFPRPRLALLGDMKELGEDSAAEHRLIVAMLRDKDIPAMLVGGEFTAATEALGAAFPCFPNSEELASYLRVHPVSDSFVLVKGSRSTGMEKLLPEL